MRKWRAALLCAALTAVSTPPLFAADSDTASSPTIYRKAPEVDDLEAAPVSAEMRQAHWLYEEWSRISDPIDKKAKADEVIALATKEQARDPNSYVAAKLLAFSYYGSHDPENALPQFETLVKLTNSDPKHLHPGAILFKAKALSDTCHDEEAEKLLQAYWAFWDNGASQPLYQSLDRQVKLRLHHQQQCYCVPHAQLKVVRQKAESGDAESETALGMMAVRGACAPRDYGEAAKWLGKAAAKGNADAQLGMGMMYIQGIGVEHDLQKALKWFRASADQGNAEAQNDIGVMYYRGDGVPQSSGEAKKWYEKAAANGNEVAKRSLLDNAAQKQPDTRH